MTHVLLESGFDVLLENGDELLLESLSTVISFTPPSRLGVPPVLPERSPREFQTVTAYRLFRHYRSRPEGINVYLLSDGSITEDDPDGTSVVWSINDRTGDAINARYVVVAWYGGHDSYRVTPAQAVLLEAEGYTLVYGEEETPGPGPGPDPDPSADALTLNSGSFLLLESDDVLLLEG